jgi:hypothetical protein
MSLFETIEKDYVQAYKAKDAVRLTVLRLLKTAVKNRLVDLCRPGGTLDDAEMLDLIDHGAPNIICTQPFACLPNHVVGKSVIKELRRRHPESNIVAVDYDPGASEVNQLNRIKLMISVAKENMRAGKGFTLERIKPLEMDAVDSKFRPHHAEDADMTTDREGNTMNPRKVGSLLSRAAKAGLIAKSPEPWSVAHYAHNGFEFAKKPERKRKTKAENTENTEE